MPKCKKKTTKHTTKKNWIIFDLKYLHYDKVFDLQTCRMFGDLNKTKKKEFD